MNHEQKLAWLILDGWVYHAYRRMREGNDYATKDEQYYIEWSHHHGLCDDIDYCGFAKNQGDTYARPWAEAPKKFVAAVYRKAKDL